MRFDFLHLWRFGIIISQQLGLTLDACSSAAQASSPVASLLSISSLLAFRFCVPHARLWARTFFVHETLSSVSNFRLQKLSLQHISLSFDCLVLGQSCIFAEVFHALGGVLITFLSLQLHNFRSKS